MGEDRPALQPGPHRPEDRGGAWLQRADRPEANRPYDDAGGQYFLHNWKTDKAWGGTCQQLVMKSADEITHPANFQFN